MIRRFRNILVLTVVVALAITGVAAGAKPKPVTVTPKKAGPDTIVKVVVRTKQVKQAFQQQGSLYAQLTPPAGSQDCQTHHPPQGRYIAGKKAVFNMDPGDALVGPGKWCPGKWTVRLYAMLDGTSDTTDSGRPEINLAFTSFKAHQ